MSRRERKEQSPTKREFAHGVICKVGRSLFQLQSLLMEQGRVSCMRSLDDGLSSLILSASKSVPDDLRLCSSDVPFCWTRLEQVFFI